MRNHRRLFVCTWSIFALVVASFGSTSASAQTNEERSPLGGKVRTYYIAADELDWDYAPSGIDQMTGKPFEGMAKFFMEHGPHRIGHI